MQAELNQIKYNKAEAGFGLRLGFGPVFASLCAFVILNALKITYFNMFLLQKHTSGIFLYKFAITLLTILIACPLIYRTRSRAFMSILYALQALYMTISLGYYLYFRSYLHMLQYFSLIREAFSVAGNSAVPLSSKMLVVLIDLPVFIFLLLTLKPDSRRNVRTGRTTGAVVLASLLILTSIEAVNFAHRDSIIHLVRDKFSGESPIVERYGTIADNIANMLESGNSRAMTSQLHYGGEISSAGSSVKAAASSKSSSTANTAAMAKSAGTAGKAAAETASSGRPNYILIQVESMDANIVNQTYKGSYVTPFLHSLESRSLYYPYVMSYHEGGGTSDCEFSVLNSVEPLQSYPALKLSGYDYPNSMVKRLDEASYTTLAFHGNVGTFYNRDVAFPKLGYSAFYDMLKMKLPENGWGLPDDVVFNYAFDRLKAVNGSFFAHFITMTSHEPFNSARHYYNNSLYDGIPDKTVKEYYNSMSYVDKSLQDFITKVQSSFKNTYIVIYGDHTPNISTGIYRQASFTMDNRYFEFVPMIIITPDGKVRKETKEAASFLDVAPTVLTTSSVPFGLKSDGANLAAPSLPAGNLPFKGGTYSRALLYQKAAQTPAG